MSLFVLRVYPEGGRTIGHLPPDVAPQLERVENALTALVESTRGHLSVTLVLELDR